MGALAGGSGRSTSTNRWFRGRKPPTAIRMALRFPGPGPGDHEPSSGMMGKDSMSSAMNIWEVQCGEVHPRGRNSRVPDAAGSSQWNLRRPGATPDSKRRHPPSTVDHRPPTLRSAEGQHSVPAQPRQLRAPDAPLGPVPPPCIPRPRARSGAPKGRTRAGPGAGLRRSVAAFRPILKHQLY